MRKMSRMPDIRNIKSIHTLGIRSIPKVQRSSYLDLYMLRREKDRLEKETFALDKRADIAKRQLNSINQRIEKLQKETHEEQKPKAYKSIPTKPLKTLSIQY